MFDDHAFNNVGYVLTTVDRVFQFFVHVLPLDNLERIAILVEQARHGALIDVIAFVFQTMKFNQPLSYAFGFCRIETTSWSCRAMRWITPASCLAGSVVSWMSYITTARAAPSIKSTTSSRALDIM